MSISVLLTDVHITTCMQTFPTALSPGYTGGGKCRMGTRPIYIHIKKDYKCWLVAHHLFEKVDWKPSNVVR